MGTPPLKNHASQTGRGLAAAQTGRAPRGRRRSAQQQGDAQGGGDDAIAPQGWGNQLWAGAGAGGDLVLLGAGDGNESIDGGRAPTWWC
jgi:hypothetical protein